jgi:hypothetical protein
MIPAFERLTEVIPLIEYGQYYVIHAARQSGKTTFLWDVEQKLNEEGKYYALYCSLESVQDVKDPEKGIPAVVSCIKRALMRSSIPQYDKFAEYADYSDFTGVLEVELLKFCQILDKPLVLFFDEADCLSEGTMIAFLRQLRNGYNSRIRAPFVHSVALVGMRNIRDFKAKVRPDSETLGSASPFNIAKTALTLTNLTKEQITELYNQHTQETGQIFEADAIDMVYQQTQGQPWLVNAIACETIEKILENDYTKPVTAPLVKQAIQTIIRRRDTHIDSLLERLKEERVRKVIEPMIVGGKAEVPELSDDFSYVKDLGLIRVTSEAIEPANPIYAEVIIRTLNWDVQSELMRDKTTYQMPHYYRDGKIDMDILLRDFQAFWRKNSEIWEERFQYKEAAPHLVLTAFLQRVVNGGGEVVREMALDKTRLDLCVIYKDREYPIELKLLRGKKTYEDGLRQTAGYMDILGCNEGSLVVFDRDPKRSWDKKIFSRKETLAGGKTITIFGC